MNDLLLADRIDGYPPFVCRTDDAGGLNWWAPTRSGDSADDYAAGAKHFEGAIGLVNDLRGPDLNRLTITPGLVLMPPSGVLVCIMGAMTVPGPIERGFVDAMARKAIVSRVTPLTNANWTDEDYWAEDYARIVIGCAQSANSPDLVSEEVMSIIDGTYNCGTPGAFIWSVCIAAAAGVLN